MYSRNGIFCPRVSMVSAVRSAVQYCHFVKTVCNMGYDEMSYSQTLQAKQKLKFQISTKLTC